MAEGEAESESKQMNLLVVTNLLTHYRLPLYQELRRRTGLELILYSDGQEWYWQSQPTEDAAQLPDVTQLRGRWLGRTRITPGLIPSVWRSRADVVVKDPNGKFALPATYLLARLRRLPFVLWASMWEHPQGGIHRLTRGPMRYLYRHSDAVVTYGRHVSEYVVSEGADPSRTFVAPQAVATQLVAPSRERWEGDPTILFIGRLEPWKGLTDLLEALGPVHDLPWRLVVLGKGSERESCEELCRTLGIEDRVEFLGLASRDEVERRIQTGAIVVIPSRRTPDFLEPWSLAVNEAMQGGSLVVASTAVGAVADGLVADGVTGFVFEQGSVPELSAALRRALGDTEASYAMATRGHEEIQAFTHRAAAQAFIDAAHTAQRRRRRRG